jgi:hypothetical protein
MKKKLARPMTQKRLKSRVSYSPRSGVFRLRRNGERIGSPSAKGYLAVQLGVKHYSLHRLAWLYVYGKFPEGVVDHIDHNKHNNALGNLRETTQVDNCKNRKLASNNTSGFVGVRWNEKRNKWTAAIKVDKKNIHLGCFDSYEEAVVVRQEANEAYGFHKNHGKALTPD